MRTTLKDGTVVESSNGIPATLQPSSLIRGWSEALQMMREGEQWVVSIPPELAYGASGSQPNIPGSSALTVTMELVRIHAGPMETLVDNLRSASSSSSSGNGCGTLNISSCQMSGRCTWTGSQCVSIDNGCNCTAFEQSFCSSTNTEGLCSWSGSQCVSCNDGVCNCAAFEQALCNSNTNGLCTWAGSQCASCGSNGCNCTVFEQAFCNNPNTSGPPLGVPHVFPLAAR